MDDVAGLLARGGTILGTSNRADPFNFPVLQGEEYVLLDRTSQVIRNYENLGLDSLIAIGGDGTMAASAGLVEMGLPIIGVPKTIDNDLCGTDVTLAMIRRFRSRQMLSTESIPRPSRTIG
jgi:6-phosphofructokinase 1